MSEEEIKTAQGSYIDETRMPILQHIIELRARLVRVFAAMLIGTLISFMYVNEIYAFLVKPLAVAMGANDTNRLIYTDLTEAFFTYVKIAIFSGVFITFPVILLQIWKFIAPGLYKNERNAILPFLVATPVLFFLGGACVYYLVIPMAWPFFLSFQTSAEQTTLPIQLEARVSEYLDLIMTLILAFGICFQLPVFLTLLAKAGIITEQFLISKRKYAIIIIFFVAAVLTPPDVISQITLAIPLMGLYEISIILIRMSAAKAAKNDANTA